MKPIRIGVIGVGNMGRNHVRILANEKSLFELISIYDNSTHQTEKLSELYGIKAATDVLSLFDEVEAVIIAVPTSLHLDYGLLAAKNGVHALIEKPLALNSEDAAVLISAFEEADKTLMVGHVERFNPVVVELEKLLTAERLTAIEARRYSSFDGRITDASVVSDLMIHDIDIVCNLLCKEEIINLQSVGSSVRSDMIDFAHCIIKFGNNAIASIAASRVSSDKVREIFVHTSKSYIKADLLSKTLNVTKNANMTIDIQTDDRGSMSYRQESISQRIFVPQIEPLVAELIHFGNCINNNLAPITDGYTALRAIKISEEVAVGAIASTEVV